MMKRLLIITLIIMSGLVQAETVTNEPTPAKGVWNFSVQKIWRQDSARDEPLAGIRNIRLDKQGNIYLLSSRRRRLHAFDFLGKHLFSFGKKGEGPGEFKHAINMFLAGDNIIVQGYNQIHYFNRKGEYLQRIGTGQPYMISAFLDSHRAVVTSFKPEDLNRDDREVHIMNFKTGEAVLLTRLPRQRTVRFSSREIAMIMRIPQAAADFELALAGNHLYFAWSDRYLIKKTDFSGKELLSFSLSGPERVKLSDSTKMSFLKTRILPRMDFSEKALSRMAAQIPDHVPCFHQIFVDKQGLIYVLAVDFADPGKRKVDVFSPAGRLLYQGEIELGNGDIFVSEPRFHEDRMIVFSEDRAGERYLTAYRISLPSVENSLPVEQTNDTPNP